MMHEEHRILELLERMEERIMSALDDISARIIADVGNLVAENAALKQQVADAGDVPTVVTNLTAAADQAEAALAPPA